MNNLPICGDPSCARNLVQCSDTFIMTSGCKDTVTDPEVAVVTTTLLVQPGAAGAGDVGLGGSTAGPDEALSTSTSISKSILSALDMITKVLLSKS